tara:strand:- start:3941 stop:4489 length:549 start_codon:yes stop_codon:yes gene_type:complete
MKKTVFILFILFGFSVNAQGYDFQQLCLDCAAAGGFYCGDDPANWTQYAPNGCVQASWINDDWEDCVDASDENGAVPTTTDDCTPPMEECDTIYVEIPVIEYETDTIIEFETEYVYITDTIMLTEYITEYLDCETGMPCNTSIPEILEKSENDGLMYNILGQPIRRPESIYIHDGKIKYMMN